MALGTKRKAANTLSKQPLDLPPGTVHAFAGATAPEGWALCDGSVVSRTTYAALYAAIGDAWGNGDGSTTFHLPDLRGRFLRGQDAGAGQDPDAVSRTAANAGGNSGDNVGSVQGHGTAPNGMSTNTTGNHNHTGSLYDAGNRGGLNSGSRFLGFADSSNGSDNYSYVSRDFTHIATQGNHSHSLSGGNTETRPVNANVNYIIKL